MKGVLFMMIDPIGMGMGTALAGMNAYLGSMKQTGASHKPDGVSDTSRSTGAADSAKKGDVVNGVDDEADKKRRFDSYECKTCENRKYQDGSDDSGVSFQVPTKIDPKSAAAQVRGHEQEHVVRNQAKAERDGDEIVSQNVVLHTGICNECGRVYISGGTTTTTIKRNAEQAEKFNVGMEDAQGQKGAALDMAV